MEKSLAVGIAGVFLVVGTGFAIGDEKLSSGPSSEYFPLAVDARWEYEVVQPNIKTRLRLIVKVMDSVSDPKGPIFWVSYNNQSLARSEHADEPEEYEVRKEGLYCLKCGGYLLKDPLILGVSWQGGDDDNPTTSRVIEVNRNLRIGGSAFHDCITIESRDRRGYRVITTFARGVGPIDIKYSTPAGELVRRELLVAHSDAKGTARN